MIRAGLAAAAPVVRAGLRALLLDDTAVEVVSAAASLEALDSSGCDVLVVLLERGAQAAAAWEAPPANSAVLWLVDPLEGALPPLWREQAVWGLLPADAAPEELLAAVHALAEGLVVISPALFAQVTAAPLQPAPPSGEAPALTAREIEILHLLARGLANKQIAERLAISTHTVKFHISSIYSRLGVSSRTEAVQVGLRLGILTL